MSSLWPACQAGRRTRTTIGMADFDAWLAKLGDPAKADRMTEVFAWIDATFPTLEHAVKWNQPMYVDHGTFILGFSAAKGHWAFTPEASALRQFRDEVVAAGYDPTENIVRVRWDQEPDRGLLQRIIAFNIEDKAETTTFWRQDG